MDILSSRRKQILEFIRRFIGDKGYAPSVREIASGCGLSSLPIVLHHLDILEREGYLHRDREVSRSIELTATGYRKATGTPLLGIVAAGEPIPVPTSETWSSPPLGFVNVGDELTQGKKGVYALKVKGTSMIDALIDDGDIVLMQQVSTVDNGEMAAVWLKDEQAVTLKRIFKERERIRLQPANREIKPIYQHPDNVEIQGKVIGVIRKVDTID